MDYAISRTCETGRHLLCPWPHGCGCHCHTPMDDTTAQAIILKLAGQRLWPDDPAEQQALADAARKADPFGRDLQRALTVLGLW